MTIDCIVNAEKNIKLGKDFYKDDRGFIYFKITNQKKCKSFKAAQLKLYIDFATNVFKEKPMPLLVDIRNVTGVLSSSTFSLLAKNAKLKTNFTKIVFIVNSLPIKLMIHNYIRIYRPSIPSRVFNTIDKGIDYLLNKPQNITLE